MKLKASETVMSDEEIINRVMKFHFGGSNNRHDLVRNAVKAQAEISFKAGRDDGVKFCHRQIDVNLPEIMETSRLLGIEEVVEWMKKNSVRNKRIGQWLCMLEYDLHAQLKKWGIKPKEAML